MAANPQVETGFRAGLHSGESLGVIVNEALRSASY
jgi:hypothetical protein